MFLSKNKKNSYTPAYPSLAHIKMGYQGVYITRTCFPDVLIPAIIFFFISEPLNKASDITDRRKCATDRRGSAALMRNRFCWRVTVTININSDLFMAFLMK